MSCKGCYTCKHTRLDADEAPCITCEHSGNAEGYEDNWEPKEPPTNAERIRMMSDEELAEWLSEYFDCEFRCPADGGGCYDGCKVKILEWLRKREGAVSDNKL